MENRSQSTNVDDIEDKKNCLNVMCDKIVDLSESRNELSQILNMVTKLETIINQKDNEMKVLKDRVDELEQYTRKENVIISGLITRHMSYARVTCHMSHARVTCHTPVSHVIRPCHMSYARVTSNSATAASMDNPSQEETNALEKHVTFFMTSYKLTLSLITSVCHAKRASPRQPDNISVCHTMRASHRQPDNISVSYNASNTSTAR